MKSPEPAPQWEKVIGPHPPLWSIPWGELWRYRNLMVMLFRRDFVSTYKQTILGPLWYVMQPLLTTLTFTGIFSGIANVSTDGLPPFLFYLSGVTFWGYFSDCLVKTSRTFAANRGLFSKVYFPRLAVPIAQLLTNLVSLGIQFALFLLLYFIYFWQGAPIHPTWRIVILPFLVVQMAMLGLGVGCLVNAVTTRYQDLANLVGFGAQLWMYVSCVVVPLSEVPERWRIVFILNPMVPIIESFRFAFFGVGIVELWQLGVSFAVSAVVFVTGVLLFNHRAKTVVDTI